MAVDCLFNLFSSGVPEYLQRMLEIEKKSELEKYSKNITITQEDFARLVFNSYAIGYNHRIKYHDFVPSHLVPTDEERKALRSSKVGESLKGSAKKFVTKVSAIFNERRYLVAHIFHNENKWHLFYFDQRDIENMRGNHWKKGVHIHFVNYLWPCYNINKLWENFDKEDASAGDKLHIRFQLQSRK